MGWLDSGGGDGWDLLTPEQQAVLACENCAGWGVDPETGDWCEECP